MFKGGALLTTDKDLVQACLKGLCTLFQTRTHTEDVKNQDESFSGLEQDGSQLVEIPKKVDDELIERTGMMKTRQMPLKESNLRLLIQLLASSITEVTSSNQSAAFQLIRVLVNFRVMLPEIYDLMEQMLDLIVLSHKRGIREAASASVISFLLHYPLGKKRFQTHLKKFIVNCSYEYEEGREAALTSLSHLLRLLPLSVLEECAQMIFLPLVLRLVNDKSKSCRGAASEAILNMCRRVSAELFATFYDYSFKWLGAISQVSDGDDQINGLIKSGACVASVLVTARPDLLKRSRRIPKWLNLIAQGLRRYSNLKSQDTSEIVLSEIPDREINDASVYSITYHLLTTIEKLYILLPSTVDEAIMNSINISGEKYSKQISSEDSDESSIISMIEELLLSQNVLIQEVAARVLNLYLNRRNPATIFDLSSTLSTLATSNALYNTSRKLCIVLNHLSLSTEHLKSIIECLTFSIRAFIMNSELTILNHQTGKKSPEKDENGKGNDEDDDSDVGPMTNIQDGVNWIMQRLRGIGTDSRGRRRIQIIKVSLC
jgi:U3 small nucleolar RNA-associated protein 20